MRHRQLGRSGLRVAEFCLGAMTFGGRGVGRTEAQPIFDAYVEAGGNFIDTANNYAEGQSEEIVGELVASERDRYVVGSKYTAPVRPDDPNARGNHRKSLVQALDQSLRRLGTEYIDLYWVHIWDGETPIEEVMRALDDAVRAGKVLYVGISDTPAWVVAQANTLADWRGWEAFCALQIEYSLVERTAERELLPMAGALGLTPMAWGPLAGGLLSGKYRSGESGRLAAKDRRFTPRNEAILEVLVEVAEQAGATPAQTALAWLRSRPDAPLPILGASRADQLREGLDCQDVELTQDQVSSLDEVSAVAPGFPHEMLERLRSLRR